MDRPSRRRRGCGCGCPTGCAALVIAVALLILGAYHTSKPLPEGLRLTGRPVAVESADLTLLADVTAVRADGDPLIRQMIFDGMLDAIDTASDGIVLDAFLFGGSGPGAEIVRPVCSELTEALLQARTRHPTMPIIVITDPISTLYGSTDPLHFRRLRRAGIPVVITDLVPLRDSNPAYSVFWRLGLRWLGLDSINGRLPNPFSANGPDMTLRSWLSLLHFKANHRKVLVTGHGSDGWRVILGSFNAHDASSRNSNLAVLVRSTAFARQVWESETAVIAMSGGSALPFPGTDPRPVPAPNGPTVTLLTEGAIRDAMLADLAAVGPDDAVDAAFFYLSHKAVRDALADAARRGATVRIILDPSKDAFGRTKNGIPNRQSALVLLERAPVSLRWADTHGEQFHPKAIMTRRGDRASIILGSANATRRNLDDFNLESDVRIRCGVDDPIAQDVTQWFERVWSNRPARATCEYEAFEDRSVFRRWMAAFQERTGMGTF